MDSFSCSSFNFYFINKLSEVVEILHDDITLT